MARPTAYDDLSDEMLQYFNSVVDIFVEGKDLSLISSPLDTVNHRSYERRIFTSSYSDHGTYASVEIEVSQRLGGSFTVIIGKDVIVDHEEDPLISAKHVLETFSHLINEGIATLEKNLESIIRADLGAIQFDTYYKLRIEDVNISSDTHADPGPENEEIPRGTVVFHITGSWTR